MWAASAALRRDPLPALGITGALTVEQAAFTLAMHNPQAVAERDEMRLAEQVMERMRAEDAWEDALPGGRGYTGPRSSPAPTPTPARVTS